MIDTLPEGRSIGTMQAPLQWILTHTSRFVGAVVITVQDGRGVILIEKGKACGYYFHHENVVLKGRSAFDYFNALQAIDFDLRKYTPEEFTRAITLYDGEDAVLAPAAPEEEPLPEPEDGGVGDVRDMLQMLTTRIMNPEAGGRGETPVAPPAETRHTAENDKIREILRQPGVEGIALFGERVELTSTGHVDFKKVMDTVEKRVHWAKEMSAKMKMGPFSQITHQFEMGDVIIAPFGDDFICIVTSSEAPLGSIRSLIRSIQAA
jgi:predicted regulator of Ras-like GTPase activity (Roadblock/LC7/MglB family)